MPMSCAFCCNLFNCSLIHLFSYSNVVLICLSFIAFGSGSTIFNREELFHLIMLNTLSKFSAHITHSLTRVNYTIRGGGCYTRDQNLVLITYSLTRVSYTIRGGER